ncbi:protein lethal(2)essential for life-like [Schistocerca nitens]|uniref:protein lethal(2)essential for life-like n=1 Tax=Schistocerca nitens TaxID=7011 RepID=UPI0021176963|nr:protein lethal(2)essential for life-like [Schistocerca nitens]XP_049793840.1 protein lethal(2)essential for life-like [Schistocerca nitens]
MALVRELFDELNRPMYLFDQNFGLGMLGDDLLMPRTATVPLLSGYYRPWRHVATRHSGTSNIQNTKSDFKVSLDVQQFKPEEINVKMVDDFVVVEGKHEERQDEHGFISRQFTRRYKLPNDVEPEAVTSKLSSDGVLTITAPKKQLPPADSKERVIQIVQTNKPALRSAPGNDGDKQEKMEQ